MAVESIARDEYSSASDVWSWGVTVWEVIIYLSFPKSAAPALGASSTFSVGYWSYVQCWRVGNNY